MKPLKPYAHSAKVTVQDELVRIVNKASALDAEFHTQWASFQVPLIESQTSGKRYNLKFNPVYAELHGSESVTETQDPVCLVISPLLRKVSANEEGEDDADVILCKARVLVHPPLAVESTTCSEEKAMANLHTHGRTRSNSAQNPTNSRRPSTSGGSTLSRIAGGVRRALTDPMGEPGKPANGEPAVQQAPGTTDANQRKGSV